MNDTEINSDEMPEFLKRELEAKKKAAEQEKQSNQAD